MDLAQKKLRRKQIAFRMRELADSFAKREPTKEQEAEFNKLDREAGVLGIEIETEECEQRANSLTQSRGRVVDPMKPDANLTPAQRAVFNTPEPMRFRDRQGNEVRVLSRGQRLADNIPPGERQEGLDQDSLGKIVRGQLTGNWNGAEAERRAMSGTVGATGGFALMPELSAQIIDVARNRARVTEAGAMIAVMNSSELTFARIDSDPTAYWRGEGAAITSSQAAVGSLNFKARACAALVPITVELVEDAPNLGAVLQGAIGTALANALDVAALRGSGTGSEPLGLRYLENVNEYDLSAASLSADTLSLIIQRVREDNHEPNGILLSPAAAGWLDRLKTGTGEYLPGPPSYLALPRYITNQIPSTLGSGSNETEIYVGDWTKLLIGVRTSIQLEVLREGTVGSDNATSQMKVFLRAYLRADVGPLYRAAFARLIGAKLA